MISGQSARRSKNYDAVVSGSLNRICVDASARTLMTAQRAAAVIGFWLFIRCVLSTLLSRFLKELEMGRGICLRCRKLIWLFVATFPLWRARFTSGACVLAQRSSNCL